METALTVAALVAACAGIAVRIFTANRRAAGRRSEREKAIRARQENELRERVSRAKKERDPLNRAKQAIDADPARAAQTLSRLMRQNASEK